MVLCCVFATSEHLQWFGTSGEIKPAETHPDKKTHNMTLIAFLQGLLLITVQLYSLAFTLYCLHFFSPLVWPERDTEADECDEENTDGESRSQKPSYV